jgi:2-polyprenyl-6-methoxyphenol hydroxylase-like FAD-dependent oxidoreductase
MVNLMALPRWHHRAVCLIGDSAHAVGPQVGHGAALSLGDAFTLAKRLRDLPDPRSAFATFEALRRLQRRRDQVVDFVEPSRQVCRLIHLART